MCLSLLKYLYKWNGEMRSLNDFWHFWTLVSSCMCSAVRDYLSMLYMLPSLNEKYYYYCCCGSAGSLNTEIWTGLTPFLEHLDEVFWECSSDVLNVNTRALNMCNVFKKYYRGFASVDLFNSWTYGHVKILNTSC